MPTVAVVGAGVIGSSWARLFATNGWDVRLSDPRPDLAEIAAGLGDTVVAVPGLAEAAAGADFVQESGPERLDLKHELYTALAAHSPDHAVLASSSSSLLPSDIGADNPAAHRILVGHPFNPPELMPLVEVVPSPATSPEIVERAMAVYRSLGKLPIRLQKEIPGFVGNRLQRALNEQASYLVQQGVITVGDLDELVKASIGLRWATVGPFEGRHLGGGPGGIRHLAAHVGSQMRFEMGTPDRTRTGEVIDQVEATYGTGDDAYQRLANRRDRRTRALTEALRAVDDNEGDGS